ncbi:torsin-1B-like [Penaeus japonicus]|uniref:torsin-1B-like n=1 Tax=Penaeus japonicus TaxID=27405 RepID=UPI001C71009B|nr:torsin-1B-like [Penaeus japonicus]
MDEPCTPRSAIRSSARDTRSKLTRSHSAQPEEWALSSSPYSSRRKPKSPGRSLTAIFTRPERTERASSEDSRTLYRRRTIGTFFGDRRFATVQEDEDIAMDTVLTESKNHNISLSLFPDFEHNEEDHLSNSYSGAYEHRDRFDIMAPVSRVESCLRRRNGRPAEENSDVSKPPMPSRNSSLLCSLLMRIGKLFFWCSVIIIVIVLAVFSLSTFITHQKSQCEQRQGLKIPVDALKEELASQVIGQDIATSVLLDAIQNFQDDNSTEPLIMWMVGWSGSGKTHTINIVRNLFPDPSQVRSVIPSMLTLTTTDLQKPVSKLLKNLDSCGPRLITIDGWDEESDISIKILQAMVKELKKPSKDKPTGKIIVIITGTEGSREINREYLKLRVEGKAREDLGLEDFMEVTRNIVQSRKLNEDLKNLIVVPFMPLEKMQVRQCVLRELDRMKENADEKRKNSFASGESAVIEEVVKQIHFIPKDQPLLSATGCKRVQPLLRLLL